MAASSSLLHWLLKGGGGAALSLCVELQLGRTRQEVSM